MAENAVTWKAKSQITLVKNTGMVEDITNDTDNLHSQYLGNQKALNTSTRYTRVDEITAFSTTLFQTDTFYSIAGGQSVFLKKGDPCDYLGRWGGKCRTV